MTFWQQNLEIGYPKIINIKFINYWHRCCLTKVPTWLTTILFDRLTLILLDCRAFQLTAVDCRLLGMIVDGLYILTAILKKICPNIFRVSMRIVLLQHKKISGGKPEFILKFLFHIYNFTKDKIVDIIFHKDSHFVDWKMLHDGKECKGGNVHAHNQCHLDKHLWTEKRKWMDKNGKAMSIFKNFSKSSFRQESFKMSILFSKFPTLKKF